MLIALGSADKYSTADVNHSKAELARLEPELASSPEESLSLHNTTIQRHQRLLT